MSSVPPEAISKQLLSGAKRSHPEWYTSLLEIGSTEPHDADDVVGSAVYAGRKVHIPGGKEMDLMCKIKAGPQRKTYTAMFEGHSSLQLPQDLPIAKVPADAKRGYAPVRVMNLSQHAITIKPHTHLAKVSQVDSVVDFSDKKQGKCHEGRSKAVCMSLDQVVVASCGVNLSEAAVENERQRALLKDLVERNVSVFSQHSMDYGHTKTVQHEIPLMPNLFGSPIARSPHHSGKM